MWLDVKNFNRFYKRLKYKTAKKFLLRYSCLKEKLKNW
ncbi:hypothetical protein STRCR_1525 [Streptococcus criceti HS-6]|uniref:Uncharacterized protein n=1 Tax=Streptococcus criceti HS-6 TaxID=873449 RepID=G5JNZ4_STRCG|nr:hypothetical protein STRCR_1525 [Streptococcus criceti HS-6]